LTWSMARLSFFVSLPFTTTAFAIYHAFNA